ncbi:MAG TPA: ATP-grasp domain-containing protein, partial [Myxococcota bacterium]|nr:ATP-grasp domain-containing protein [Myxococcota bacterium]
PVVEKVITAPFDDVDAARTLAKGVDVVTLEIEKIGLAALTAAAEHAPCRPDATILETIQDRALQKRWLKGHAIPIGPYMEAATPAQLKRAAEQLGGRCFAKAAHGGYDGRGQMELASADEAVAAWDELKAESVVCEFALDLDKEISVLVARSAGGEIAVYPVAHNHHEKRILAWSVIPAEIPEELATKAQDLARGIADGLKIVGLLAVEMFLTKTGELLVNELAPRPHNSYHASDSACVTSQFEQVIRAVCGLPLGSVATVRPSAIANILGDAWEKGEPKFERALAIPNLKLSLYGKQPKPGRKMGHLTASAETSEDAVAVVRRGLNGLRG